MPPPVLPQPILGRLLPDPPVQEERASGVAQWVNCDIRSFDYSVLGQYVVTSTLARTKRDRFQVIVADPPWVSFSP